MKPLLIFFGLTGLSHFLVLSLAPDWAADNSWIMVFEFALSAAVLWQWGQFKKSHPPPTGGTVVDLDEYRKAKENKGPSWVCVYRSGDPAEMSLLSSLFEANQIDFQIAGRHSSSMLPNIGAVPMEMMVLSDHVNLAKELLEDFSNLPPN